MPSLKPTIHFHQGRILVDAWPADLPPPHGTRAEQGRLAGPARLRHRVRHTLAHAAVHYLDRTGAAQREALPSEIQAHQQRATLVAPPGLIQTLRSSQHRGLVIGQTEETHWAIAQLLTSLASAPLLVVVPDTATAHRWQSQSHASHTNANTKPTIVTVTRAARDMHWLGGHHDALLVEGAERMPATLLDQALDESAALARIGLAATMSPRDAERWCTRIGPVLAVASRRDAPRRALLQVPMPCDIEGRYQDAWGTFLGAYDRFVAVRGDAGFGTFLAQARSSPSQRPAVHAWHEAIRCAAWHENKSLVVEDLLRRHTGRRMLLFTPDRACAYELSKQHLIPALTAELPQRERTALLDAFASGALPALAGPRLLDSGVAEHSADVGALLGGGNGSAQRASRCRRVRDDGIIFELVSQNTLEVGRAHRWHHATTRTTTVVHER